jgi:hypothetical protein
MDAYWVLDSSDEGCCTLDLTVMRYDGDHWVNGTDLSKNDGYYTWNTPYYAPCERLHRELLAQLPGRSGAGVQPPNDAAIMGGGNRS